MALECYGVLSRSSLAPLMNHTQLAAIARICKLVTYRKGQILYEGGAQVKEMYLLSAGGVELYRQSADDSKRSTMSTTKSSVMTPTTHGSVFGADSGWVSPPRTSRATVNAYATTGIGHTQGLTVYRTLQPGQWFGQCAALGCATRQCSARAAGDVQCLTLDWSTLADHLESVGFNEDNIRTALGSDISKSLRAAPFLHGLTRDQASFLSTLFQPKFFSSGSIIFDESERLDVGPSLFFCLKGSLNMIQTDYIRGPQIIRQISAGQFFGEACAIFNLPRIASVRATSDTWLSELPYKTFIHFLRSTLR